MTRNHSERESAGGARRDVGGPVSRYAHPDT